MSGKRLLLSVLVACALTCGCAYKGAKVTEGTDLSVGLSIPGTEGAASVTILNYLSGFRLGLAQNSQMQLTYTVAETNSWLGIATTRTVKSIKAAVDPVGTAPRNTGREPETEPDEPGGDADGR